jgi:hypothetical protein
MIKPYPNKECEYYSGNAGGTCTHYRHHGAGPYPCIRIHCMTDEALDESIRHCEKLLDESKVTP